MVFLTPTLPLAGVGLATAAVPKEVLGEPLRRWTPELCCLTQWRCYGGVQLAILEIFGGFFGSRPGRIARLNYWKWDGFLVNHRKTHRNMVVFHGILNGDLANYSVMWV